MKLIQKGLCVLFSVALGGSALHGQVDPHAGHDHAPGDHSGHDHPDTPTRQESWSDGVKQAFATLPVQDGGRVKPLDSLAGLRLLTLNGKRKLKLTDGSKLSQDEWLLDVLFFPEQARDYPCFRVQNAAVLTAIEVTAKSKRDWYSYNELIGGRAKLASEAQRLHSIEAAKQTEVQRQTLKLASDFGTFEALAGTLAFTRHDYPTGASPLLRELFGDEQNASLSVILSKAAELRALTQEVMADNAEDFDAIQSLFAELGVALDAAAQGPALFPPPAGLEAAQSWWDISTVVDGAFTLEVDCQAQIELVAFFERLEAQKLQPAAFEAELVSLNEYARELAEARGEYGQIPLEVKLYRMDLFTNSLVLFLLGFILAAFGWVFPRARWLPRGVWALAILATSAVTLGIVLRCIIRQRPPVISLYDTILFITACGVLVTLLLEFLTRRRVALSLGCLFGVAGMFLAGRYELKEVSSAGDTMASVVAVLDTNYYLAIHVTTVTLGYVGGLVAGLFAHVWILGKLFGVARDDKSFYKTLSRMIYGVLCFCLFFAIFGTIMGGVWANDSWGRFWGWDPKENGALLICLWVLMTLHARMGGYARDRGMAVLAVLAGVVVSASWWGVNLLNVGLHSYGFTSGVARTLYAFWAVEGLVVLASGIDWLAHRHAEEPRKLAVGKEA